MLEIQPKGLRGYFMLPQAPEDAGYYVYGTPDQGGGQYAHPVMMALLFFIEREWQAIDRRKFGVGTSACRAVGSSNLMTRTRTAFRWTFGLYEKTVPMCP